LIDKNFQNWTAEDKFSLQAIHNDKPCCRRDFSIVNAL